MSAKNIWTKEMMKNLYTCKFEKGMTQAEMSKKLGKSVNSISNKLKRTDWDEFLGDPDGYLKGDSKARKWTQAEMGLLYAYMEEDRSYGTIAKKIGRGRVSVERKAQTTDWKAWLAAVGDDPQHISEGEVPDEEDLTAQLVEALVVLSRSEVKRLADIQEDEFRRKVNYEADPLPVSFAKIKAQADKELELLGLKNPEEVEMGEGTYVVVGDSHGKFTSSEMFDFLHQVNKTLKPKKIIHLGHIMDDDNDISYNWGKFKNLTIVAKVEELHEVQDQRGKFDFSYDIVRGCITLGNDLTVMNQDLITDYVKTPLRSMDSEILDQKVIVNCHRLEFFSKCCESGDVSYIASPGALCEKHVIKTIKQIDFEDGRKVKMAKASSFHVHRRKRHMNKYWKQGMTVVHVDSEGEHTIVPCLIRKVKKGYATAYFDKMISNTGVHKPTKKIFISADAHSPKHDCNVLDIQEQIVKDYKPDAFVNLGDAADYGDLNHHIMDRGGVIFGDILESSARTHHVMKRQATWAKECHVQKGNHERFANDFIEKFPQLRNILEFEFLCAVEGLDYQITELKTPLKIGDATFVHGDMRLWGQTGSNLEKVSKTFGDNTFMGHIHYPAIRYGTYSVGLTGELDQNYNEANASGWIHGFGLCNQYQGKSWPTTIAIVSNECRINKKTYIPKNPDNWELKDYSAEITFNTK